MWSTRSGHSLLHTKILKYQQQTLTWLTSSHGRSNVQTPVPSVTAAREHGKTRASARAFQVCSYISRLLALSGCSTLRTLYLNHGTRKAARSEVTSAMKELGAEVTAQAHPNKNEKTIFHHRDNKQDLKQEARPCRPYSSAAFL